MNEKKIKSVLRQYEKQFGMMHPKLDYGQQCYTLDELLAPLPDGAVS